MAFVSARQRKAVMAILRALRKNALAGVVGGAVAVGTYEGVRRLGKRRRAKQEFRRQGRVRSAARARFEGVKGELKGQTDAMVAAAIIAGAIGAGTAVGNKAWQAGEHAYKKHTTHPTNPGRNKYGQFLAKAP
jgi:hypothetical protein